jgi:hypothetical protein
MLLRLTILFRSMGFRKSFRLIIFNQQQSKRRAEVFQMPMLAQHLSRYVQC